MSKFKVRIILSLTALLPVWTVYFTVISLPYFIVAIVGMVGFLLSLLNLFIASFCRGYVDYDDEEGLHLSILLMIYPFIMLFYTISLYIERGEMVFGKITNHS